MENEEEMEPRGLGYGQERGHGDPSLTIPVLTALVQEGLT